MDEGNVDIYDDSLDESVDTGADETFEDTVESSGTDTEPGTDISDTAPGDNDLESLITGILDGYFSQDGNAGEGGLTGTETADGTESDGVLDTDGTGMETDDGSGMDDAGMTEGEGLDIEILSEMNETLHIHTENVQSFFADTVSGNAFTITPDDGMTALFEQGIENQTLFIDNQLEILDRLDALYVSVMLLFVVLCFDMLQRFAKRIIRNFMRGDGKNNGTNI